MVVTLYEVQISWDVKYYLDEAEATKAYRLSGEDMKCLIKVTVNLTPDVLVSILNNTGLNICGADYVDTEWLE